MQMQLQMDHHNPRMVDSDLLSKYRLSSSATPTICHIVEVNRAFLSIIWMNNATFYQDRISLAEKLGFTTATFDAHIYTEMVGIYILMGQFCRFYVDSGYCVPYSELQQRRCSPYVTI